MKNSILIILTFLIQICFSSVIKIENKNKKLTTKLNFKNTIDFLYKETNLNLDQYLLIESNLNVSDNLVKKNDFKKKINQNKKKKFKKIPKDKIKPIILIPGLEGSQLTATLDKKTRSHYYCRKKQKEPFIIWINYEEFVLPAVNCFVDNMKLHYNNETRKTTNTEGVFVQVPYFGSTEGVETLTDNRFLPQYYYFKELVDSLIELGYERNKTIKGAPFDFRLAPNEQDEYFKNLIELIEKTYLENNKNKVVEY